MTNPSRRSRKFRVELPTLALAFVIYALWLALTFFWQDIPVLVSVILGGWLIAWQGSLQHEVMHGHPTRHRWINDAIGFPPLSLWLPYSVYRISHLRHHHDEMLTDPIEDPESAYYTERDWQGFGPLKRRLLTFNTTFLGRMTVGPAIMLALFLKDEARQVIAGVPGQRLRWFVHGLGVVAVLIWLIAVCGMPLWLYALWVYVGAALTRMRAFAEHKFAERHEERTAIVERGGLFGLLFLNNNLHVLHHLKPAVPWYDLPEQYQAEREALVTRNGGLVYRSYSDVVRRFLTRPHDDPLHPKYRGGAGQLSLCVTRPAELKGKKF